MLGIRAFRLSRAAHLSRPLEPVFERLATFIPVSGESVQAILPSGATLAMPPGYRDTRTVATGLFQKAETELFQLLLHSGMTVADVGAYVGYFTVLASRLVGPGGSVFAFEPDDLAFGYLAKNVAQNACTNVVTVRKAVSDRTAVSSLVRDPRGPESYLSDEFVDAQSRQVETVSLDSFFEAMAWPRVDLVKMNIEGGELRALRGMTSFSGRNPNLHLIMELNPAAMRRAGVSRSDLTSALRQLGFQRCRIVERGLKDLTGTELVPSGGVVYNLLLTK
jgi:FkbM family methyltransferase